MMRNFFPSNGLMSLVKQGLFRTNGGEASFLRFTGVCIISAGDEERLFVEFRDFVSWSVMCFRVLMVSYLLGWSEP